MEIIVGKTAGFCYGVKRAVDGSIEELKSNDNKTIYCLGEIVHNKQVVKGLKEKGINFIEDINEVKYENSIVIIRAHGIDKKVYDLAKNKNIQLVDYTCPNVLRIHKIAEEYKEKGYFIFLTGSKEHPEIIGIMSHCGQSFKVIKDEEDLKVAIEEFKKTNMNKLLLISQTTYSMKKFEDIRKILEKEISKNVDLVIKNTICLATETRQKETKQLSAEVDKMLIIGGKNSSNTKKLYEIAQENCEDTICIETKDDLSGEDFNNVEEIGIMAGASTPQESIDEVVDFINNI